MGTPHRGPLEWKALIQEFEGSGLTIKEYCRRCEVSHWTFREWRRRVAEEQPEAKLVEIGTVGLSGRSGGSLRLTVGPVRIEIGTPVDEANLTAVLRAVQRSRC